MGGGCDWVYVVQLLGFEMSLCCWSSLTNLAGNKKDIVRPSFLAGVKFLAGSPRSTFEKSRRTKSCTRRVLAAVQKQAEAGRYMKTFILALILTQSTRSSVTESNLLLLRKARLALSLSPL